MSTATFDALVARAKKLTRDRLALKTSKVTDRTFNERYAALTEKWARITAIENELKDLLT